MKKSIMKKWVAALRSGAYKQGKEQLRTENNEFCCLGVLCNLHAQAHPNVAKHELNPEYYLNCNADLPHEVMVWAGFKEYNSTGYMVSYNDELAGLNDNGKSFKQLANIIEKHYESL